MSNSGKVWDIREAYKKQRGNDWSISEGAPLCMWSGGGTPSVSNVIDKVNPLTTGNATDFGDLATATQYHGGAGNKIKGVFGGGAPGINTIQTFNFQSEGNCSDFGDLTQARLGVAACGNEVICLFGGGDNSPSYYNIIDQISYATTGNAVDYGDLTTQQSFMAASSSTTRGVWFGGNNNPPSGSVRANTHFVNFASRGDATSFGDMITAKNQNTASSNNVKAVVTNGQATLSSGSYEQCIIATTGSFTNFGQLTAGRFFEQGAGSQTRGLYGGGANPSKSNIIDFCSFEEGSTFSDFGDLTVARSSACGIGNSEGGMGGAQVQRPSATYMPGSGRALMSGGQTAPADALVNTVEMCHIPTAGNLSNFGDLASVTSNMPGNAASVIRSIVYSGYSPASPYYNNTIQCKEFATLGNYFDFGDPTQQRYALSSGNVGSPTRGVFMGGYAPGSPYFVNIIDYVTIASVGNGTDFGDLATATNNAVSCGSSTRGVCLGGYTGSQDDTIQYVTIASTGNATDFGNLTAAKSGGTGVSSSTRGIMAGGTTGSIINVIEYITIASTGDGTDFGDLTQARKSLASGSNSTRGVFMGGSTPSKVNTVDFITIATTGDATDFGDVSIAKRESAGTCDAHGGLQ